MNKSIFSITTIFFLGILCGCIFLGCGEKTYKGKYITVAVPYEPMDEFEHEGWIILSFELQGKRPEEGELYRFWLFRNGKKTRELWLSVKIVNNRMFYLQEKRGENTVSHASFVAPPTYEAIKERIKALLSSEK